MARTNVDLDDELVAEVMRRFGVTTKKDAVVVGAPLDKEFLLGLEGIGSDGDLDELRRDQPDELS
ncbi:type II toxin-antitoxin system VapB family antitoxin [Mycolicibacterium pulveris]|uniref:type II toxin-antitoxin system VapB family antitoxin n=1 Tax=Mycolicibacterium pulveris TaxID=36813 RepID=UPI003CFBAF80